MDRANINDKLFLDGDKSTGYSYTSINCVKGHLNENGLFFIIEGYRETTNLLLEKLVDNKPEDWLKIDSLIFPLLFNFRHYLEIIIKDTIRYYRLYNKEIFSNEIGFLKEHSLTELWKVLSPYLKSNYENEVSMDTDSKAIENLLIEFDSIDKGSFSFRYPFNSNSKINGEIVFSVGAMTIDLNNLASTIKKMISYFEGINWHIAEILDNSLTQ